MYTLVYKQSFDRYLLAIQLKPSCTCLLTQINKPVRFSLYCENTKQFEHHNARQSLKK